LAGLTLPTEGGTGPTANAIPGSAFSTLLIGIAPGGKPKQ
jgi:hypothetical protein